MVDVAVALLHYRPTAFETRRVAGIGPRSGRRLLGEEVRRCLQVIVAELFGHFVHRLGDAHLFEKHEQLYHRIRRGLRAQRGHVLEFRLPSAPWQARQGASFSSGLAKAGSAPARNAAREAATLPVRCINSRLMAHADLTRRSVSDAIDRAIVVIGQQHRPVLQPFHFDGPSDIIVVLDEAGDERLDRLERFRPG